MAKCQFFRSGGGGGEKVANGTWTQSTTDRTKITLGFKPKYLAIQASAGSSSTNMIVYNIDVSPTSFKFASQGTYATDLNFGSSTGSTLYSIDNDGFTMNKSSSAISLEYMAIG